MEPKKKINRHNLIKPKFGYTSSNEELISRINEASNRILRNSQYGIGDWVIMSSEVHNQFNEVLVDSGYQNVEFGDFRVEGDTYIQDVTIRPYNTPREITINVDNFTTLSASTTTFLWD